MGGGPPSARTCVFPGGHTGPTERCPSLLATASTPPSPWPSPRVQPLGRGTPGPPVGWVTGVSPFRAEEEVLQLQRHHARDLPVPRPGEAGPPAPGSQAGRPRPREKGSAQLLTQRWDQRQEQPTAALAQPQWGASLTVGETQGALHLCWGEKVLVANTAQVRPRPGAVWEAQVGRNFSPWPPNKAAN